MQSKDLDSWGIIGWYAITSDNVPEVMEMLPVQPGVYVFRTVAMITRARGASDIAYIGKGTGGGGVQDRVRRHFHPATQESTNTPSGRINQWRNEWGYDVEIGWLARSGSGVAGAIEREMLEAFEKDHHDLPPINRSMPRG